MMKLPKTVMVSGYEYSIIQKPKRSDGEGDIAKHIITIGTQRPKEIPHLLLHEIMEVVMLEHSVRYLNETEEGDDQVLFSFAHKEFTRIMNDFAGAIWGLCFIDKGEGTDENEKGE